MATFTKTCGWCGNEFTYTSSHGGAVKYCSPKCKKEATSDLRKAWKRAHPDRVRAHRRKSRRGFRLDHQTNRTFERTIPKYERLKAKRDFTLSDIQALTADKLPDIVGGILCGDMSYVGHAQDRPG